MNRDIDLVRQDLLRAKQLYEDILILSIQQKQLMDAEDEQSWPMESIIELQDKCQVIMQQIDELDFAEVFGNYPEQKRSGNNAIGENDQLDSDKFQETMAQIRKTMHDIQTVELSCQAKLEEAKRIIKGKIIRLRANKKAQNAYNHRNSNESAWFFDKKR